MNRFSVCSVIVLIHLLASVVLVSGQDGLYAPTLPGDTSYVRVIHAGTDGMGPVTIDVGPIRIGPVLPGTASDYHPVRPGVFVIFAAGTRAPLTAGPKSFHSVVVTDDEILLIEDAYHDDPLRAQLVVYNVTSVSLQVDAVVPSATLFEAVGPGSSAALAVNAIRLTVSVTPTGAGDAGTGEAADVARYETNVSLTRGDSYSIIVWGPDLRGVVVRAELVRPAQR